MMPETTTTGQRIYALIDSTPRSDYGIAFRGMHAVLGRDTYRAHLRAAYRYALAQFDGEEMTVATILREEIESHGWQVEGDARHE